MQVDREQKRHSYLLWPNRRLDASSLIELDVSDSLTRSGVAHNDSLPPAKFFPTGMVGPSVILFAIKILQPACTATGGSLPALSSSASTN